MRATAAPRRSPHAAPRRAPPSPRASAAAAPPPPPRAAQRVGAALLALSLALGAAGAARAGTPAAPPERAAPPGGAATAEVAPARAPQEAGGCAAASPQAAAPTPTRQTPPRPAPAAAKPAAAADAGRAARRALLDEKRKAHAPKEVSYSEFWELLCRKRVKAVCFAPDGESLQAFFKNGSSQRVVLPFDPDLLPKLEEVGAEVSIIEPNALLWAWQGVARGSTPLLALGGVAFLFKKVTEEPSDDFMSPHIKAAQSDTGVTLADVAGLGPAKEEAAELVGYLRNAKHYLRLGAQLPAGVLMVGPPGTGKTLLARAIAGEAGVPFFFAAGSEFMEMFVGVGAARVRNLWEKARAQRPCIIFIDEFDAVGAQRSAAGAAAGSEEAANTINQLLTEMDGFEDNSGLVVLAATNRPGVLDKALTRPGRFDRWLRVPLPDCAGRIEILRVHARGKGVSPDVDFARVARATAGWSGADLACLMNEAAISTARSGEALISTECLFESVDNLRRDPNSGSMMLSVRTGDEEEAIAEMGDDTVAAVVAAAAGKALVATLLEGAEELQKVHCFPSGEPTSLAFFLPSEASVDAGVRSVGDLRTEMVLRLAARAAVTLLDLPEGPAAAACGRDVAVAATVARELVLSMGATQSVGPVSYMDAPRESFLAGDGGSEWDRLRGMSPRTATLAFVEASELVARCETAAAACLARNWAAFEALRSALRERRVMRGTEIAALLGEAGATKTSLAELEGDAGAESLQKLDRFMDAIDGSPSGDERAADPEPAGV